LITLFASSRLGVVSFWEGTMRLSWSFVPLMAQPDRFLDTGSPPPLRHFYSLGHSSQIRHRVPFHGPKHGPNLNVSYRGAKGKTTGYHVPQAAEEATREEVAAWQQMQQYLRELAELNTEHNLQRAREADSQ
jgi:hypothetical protein